MGKTGFARDRILLALRLATYVHSCKLARCGEGSCKHSTVCSATRLEVLSVKIRALLSGAHGLSDQRVLTEIGNAKRRSHLRSVYRAEKEPLSGSLRLRGVFLLPVKSFDRFDNNLGYWPLHLDGARLGFDSPLELTVG